MSAKMINRISSFPVIVVILLCFAITAVAKTDWQVRQEFKLEQAPIDLLVSSKNKWIYILTGNGQILIYTTRGQLKDTINVGPDVDHIKAGPRDDMLFLLSGEDKTVRAITIDFTEEITTQGSPARGPADAPVTIAVFNDFQ
jgi:hypothetical protein